MEKQFNVLTLVFLLSLILIFGLNLMNENIFQRFIGEFPAELAGILVSIVGFLALKIIVKKFGFALFDRKVNFPWTRIIMTVLTFVMVSILVDINDPFSKDMNLLFPESLLFYPVIALYVEIVFHVIPLLVLTFIFSKIFANQYTTKLHYFPIILVALLEPVYQILFMMDSPTWTLAVVWINLFLFNLFQLIIFKKINFVAMYGIRLLYYLFWHIVWGQMRLEILF